MEQPSSWTDDRVMELKRFTEDGLSASQIAEKLGVTRSSVIGKVHREGFQLKFRPIRSPDAKCRGARVPKSSSRPHKTRRLLPSELYVPLMEADEPSPVGKPLLDLLPEDCRFPIGDPQKQDFHFCCRPKLKGLSYCGSHARLVFQQPGMSQ